MRHRGSTVQDGLCGAWHRACRPAAVLALLFALLVAPARAQVSDPDEPGDWWLNGGFGVAFADGAYGEFLRDVVWADISISKERGPWRYGVGLRFGSQKMDDPYQDEREWARLEVFGSVTRTFGALGRTRPFLELRPAVTRVHPRSLVFRNIPIEEFQEGLNPTPSTDGVALTVRPGVEIDLNPRLALDLSASATGYVTGDYDLSPIGREDAGSGLEWGARVGLAWRPFSIADADYPGTDTEPRNGWGVPRSWGWATGQMLAINLVATTLQEYLGGESSYPVEPHSWWYNIDHGFEYDDNEFQTNQLIHPFNGAAYFNSARANGIGFWGSSAMAMVGAVIWECCGETQPMSWNDQVSTGLGGISQGEASYRLSSLILDNTVTGRSRFWREFSAFLVDPIRGFNRVVSGRATRAGENPTDSFDWRPPWLDVESDIGARVIGGDGSLAEETQYFGFIDVEVLYGSPFEHDQRRPFERFDLDVEAGVGDKTLIGRFLIRGDLWSWTLGGDAGPEIRDALAIEFDFDYMNTQAYEYGGQSFGVAYYHRFGSPDLRLTTRLVAQAIAGGAVNADYSELAAIPDPRQPRDYDYGPGLGVAAEMHLGRQARRIASLSYRYATIFIENGSLYNPEDSGRGSDARHQVHRFDSQVIVPVNQRWGIGAGARFFYRNSLYDDPILTDRSEWTPELRLFLTRSWL